MPTNPGPDPRPAPPASETLKGIDGFVDELYEIPEGHHEKDQIRTVLLAFVTHVRRQGQRAETTPDTRADLHRCSSCGYRWEGSIGAELCGNCWRAAQDRKGEPPPAPHAVPPCEWREDEDGIWHTACGHEFTFESDPPHAWVQFCCYCGKRFQEHAYDELAKLREAEREAASPLSAERVRVLERAVGNCFMMAKREIARLWKHDGDESTLALTLERWRHVQRFCETTGSKSDILRGQLPDELTEGEAEREAASPPSVVKPQETGPCIYRFDGTTCGYLKLHPIHGPLGNHTYVSSAEASPSSSPTGWQEEKKDDVVVARRVKLQGSARQPAAPTD